MNDEQMIKQRCLGFRVIAHYRKGPRREWCVGNSVTCIDAMLAMTVYEGAPISLDFPSIEDDTLNNGFQVVGVAGI